VELVHNLLDIVFLLIRLNPFLKNLFYDRSKSKIKFS